MNELDETLPEAVDIHQLEVRAISTYALIIGERSLYEYPADHIAGFAKDARTQE